MTIASNLATQWVSGTTYTKKEVVINNHVQYRAIVTTFTSSVEPRLDPTNWTVQAVTDITDYYNLIEAVALQLNVKENPEITKSIPLFIKLAEQSFQTTLRVPAQIRKEMIDVETSSTDETLSRVTLPTDLLEIKNVYIASQTSGSSGGFNNLIEKGHKEIIALDNYQYRDITLSQSGGLYNDSNDSSNKYSSMGYYAGNGIIDFAPRLGAGSSVIIEYYGAITKLGETADKVNANGEFINAAGQTVEQWIAAGNPASTFIIATEVVIQNWFTSAAPQLLLYASILKGLGYLKADAQMLQIWQQNYRIAYDEVMELVRKYEANRPSAQVLESYYPI